MARPKIEKTEDARPPEPPEVRRWLRIADEVVGKQGGERAAEVDRPLRSMVQDYERRVREVALAQLKRSR